MAEASRGHDAGGFASSLTGVSEHTRRAYTHDVDEFVAWCERGGCPRRVRPRPPSRCGATSRTCRRAGFGKATISRKAASVHAYVRYLRRHGVVDRDVAGAAPHRARAEEAAACAAPRRRRRAARRLADQRRDPDDPRALRDVAHPRAALRRRAAGQRVLRSRRRRRRPPPRHRHRARKGRKGPPAAARRPGLRRRRGLPRTAARPAAASTSATAALFVQRPGPPHDAPGRRGGSSPAIRSPTAAPCIPTPCATPTPRTCSKAEPICELFRSCSDTPMWERRRSTLT